MYGGPTGGTRKALILALHVRLKIGSLLHFSPPPRATPRAKSEPPVSPIIPTLEVLLVELIESKFMFSLSVLSLSFENCCAISSYV